MLSVEIFSEHTKMQGLKKQWRPTLSFPLGKEVPAFHSRFSIHLRILESVHLALDDGTAGK